MKHHLFILLPILSSSLFAEPLLRGQSYFLKDWTCLQSGKATIITAQFKEDFHGKWLTGDFSVDGKGLERCHMNVAQDRAFATLVCVEGNKYWKEVSGSVTDGAPWVLKGTRNLGKKSETLTQTLTFVGDKEFKVDYSNGDPTLTCTKK